VAGVDALQLINSCYVYVMHASLNADGTVIFHVYCTESYICFAWKDAI